MAETKNETKNETVIVVDSRLEKIVPKFLSGQRDQYNQAMEAYKRRDFQALMLFGHKSKGTCGGYGFTVLGQLGDSLEKAAQAENDESVRKVIAAIGLHLQSIKVVYR